MNINIGDYTITSDTYNLILNSRIRNSDPKSKRYGEVYLRPIGYFPNLKMALNELVSRSVRDSDATSVQQLFAELERIENAIQNALREVSE